MRDVDATMRAVATILSIAVLVDHRQRDREMIEFAHCLMTINQRLRPGVILPRTTILTWFEEQKPDMIRQIAADDFQIFVTTLLHQIEDPELQSVVLAAICSISVCDYELRDEEAELIKTARTIWETGLPQMMDMELMAG